MGKVREHQAAYRAKARKARKAKRREMVLDAGGKHVGIILDLPTYQSLLEAQEELEDIRDFDENANRAVDEFKKGEYLTLDEYKRRRKAKRG